MKKITIAFCIAMLPIGHVFAQMSPAELATAERDRQAMMEQLHITSLRPGPSSSLKPGTVNPGNYDEAKANPYPVLPDPLVLKNGKKVTSAKMWWVARRPEIVADFDREIYGRVPANTPKISWVVVSTVNEKVGDIPVVTKKLIGHADNSAYPSDTVDIQLTLTVPANAKKPVPVIMQFVSGLPAANVMPVAAGPTWQEQVLAKGWGCAVLAATSIQADNGAGLSKGIIGLVNQGQARKPDDWGMLRAWAWGASRALDYLETNKTVNAKAVGLAGHSRYGKAAIIAMAYDQRFAIGYISSSGEGGVKLSRRNYGEVVENLAAVKEFHWMAGNFLKYAGPLHWNDLPVDAHELVALCAPRPVFISGGDKGDAWTDPKGMFMAAAAAGPVYRLLGKKDMGTTVFPAVETSLTNGDLAFRQHSAGHTDVPNWPFFIAFASRYLK